MIISGLVKQREHPMFGTQLGYVAISKNLVSYMYEEKTKLSQFQPIHSLFLFFIGWNSFVIFFGNPIFFQLV